MRCSSLMPVATSASVSWRERKTTTKAHKSGSQQHGVLFIDKSSSLSAAAGVAPLVRSVSMAQTAETHPSSSCCSAAAISDSSKRKRVELGAAQRYRGWLLDIYICMCVGKKKNTHSHSPAYCFLAGAQGRSKSKPKPKLSCSPHAYIQNIYFFYIRGFSFGFGSLQVDRAAPFAFPSFLPSFPRSFPLSFCFLVVSQAKPGQARHAKNGNRPLSDIHTYILYILYSIHKYAFLPFPSLCLCSLFRFPFPFSFLLLSGSVGSVSLRDSRTHIIGHF